MNSTQKERREILEKTIHEIRYKIVLTKKIIANNEKEINQDNTWLICQQCNNSKFTSTLKEFIK